MSNETVLVTGATGFVGQNVTRKLLEERYLVYAIVRDIKKFKRIFPEHYNNLVPIEIINPEEKNHNFYAKLITEYDISSVIHIAAITGEKNIPWDKYYKTNVLWTKNLAMGFINANVDHNLFIFTSTVGVYGTIPKYLPADENHPYNPDGKYHESKALAEKELIALKNEKNLPLVIFRPSTMYGEGDYGFLYKIFRLTKKRLFPLANSNFKIHLLDVKTLADVYLSAISAKVNNYELRYFIFNIADKEPIEMQKLITYIKKLGGGYVVIPANILRILIKLLGPYNEYSIKLKLISQDRFYELTRLKKEFKCKLGQTLDNLEKYRWWYVYKCSQSKCFNFGKAINLDFKTKSGSILSVI